jgi:nitrilase
MAIAAVVQMVSSSQVASNLTALQSYFSKAQAAGAKLLVLPENFAFMGKQETDKLAIAEIYGQGELQEAVSKCAKQYKMWVIAGTLPLKGTGDRARSSCLVYDDAGKCVARYDKIHLFDVQVSDEEAHQESHTIEPGDKVVVVDTPIGRVGLTVCYDLRFPELYRQLVIQGAEVFSIPSAFTAVTGAAHWDMLCRARAVENLCYVLAANQGGLHDNGRHTYGHSMIVDPWGSVIAEQQKETGVVAADIDLSHLRQLRKMFPCNEHHVLSS